MCHVDEFRPLALVSSLAVVTRHTKRKAQDTRPQDNTTAGTTMPLSTTLVGLSQRLRESDLQAA
eukprot:m.159819 g.159819  ORF g.159819 m.159819 type:complete len:64 (+) comp17612_c0_seq6:2438-2629(+)